MVGVLALQGAVREHLDTFESCEVPCRAVKKPSGLNGINALVIPGGESTTIGKLIDEGGFAAGIREFAASGLPVLGTCAGMVLLAKQVEDPHGPLLGLADISVKRNAFGRQAESFECALTIRGIEDEKRPFTAVFIRAPVISEARCGVELMARVGGSAVMARDSNLLMCAFHPELAGDNRVHRYFLGMAGAKRFLPEAEERDVRSF